jgi:hypothetical protein
MVEGGVASEMTTRIEAVLDAIFQAPPDWPTISDLGLVALFDSELRDVGALEDTYDLVALLPETFIDQSRGAREAALRKMEHENPVEFAALITYAYNVYYSAPGVLSMLEEMQGYPARPPLYVGYKLSEFDESLLEPQRRRSSSLFREV